MTRTMLAFEHLAPATVEELLELLERHGERAKILAGGTDLIPKMKSRALRPDYVISLGLLDELNTLCFDPADGLRIGCRTVLRDLERHPAVREHYPALYEGVHCIASTQIRNAGTVVGNLCNAVPSADSAPGLLVLGAKLRLLSRAGERLVPLEEFFTGVCRTAIRPDELVAEVLVPAPPAHSGSHYISYTLRKALDLAIVGAAAMVERDGERCREVRIALGAVAPTPRRAAAAEAVLRGARLTAETIAEAARAAAQEDCAPITDMRATAGYRREIVRVITEEAIRVAAGRAAGEM